jgi:hypothetical protein
MNMLAIVLTIIAFALAVHAINESGVDQHFSLLSHHTVGLIIFIASVVQGLNGIFRPRVPHSRSTTGNEKSQTNASSDAIEDGMMENEAGVSSDKSILRTVWEYGHRFMGVGLLACSWWQVQSGLYLFAMRFDEEDLRGVFWGVALGITGLILVLLGYHRATMIRAN